jgi:hypothetical protein
MCRVYRIVAGVSGEIGASVFRIKESKSALGGLIGLKYWSTALVQNEGVCLPIDTVYRPKRRESRQHRCESLKTDTCVTTQRCVREKNSKPHV